MEFIKKDPKIFIISGKARSGKNEISKIIEKYYSNKKTITISFGHYIKDYAKRVSDWDGREETKPRELLQQLGIELIKNKINSKLFINRILEDIEIFSYFYDIIIVNDARLIDEIETLKENYPNSTSIRVIRNNHDNKLTNEQKNHLTEVGLDSYNNFDYIVENDDSLKDKIFNILSEV
ncbi:MAG: hypothetical protein IKL65_01635 [Bacilli bacterium]|nr:hypothetical protein [Bacilli bacterium]